MSDSFNPGYPVYHYEEGTTLPDSGIYYVLAGNGVFMHKDMGVMKGLVRVDGVDFLKDVENQNVRWTGPKIPFEVAYKIKRFFNIVVQKYRAEACTVLYLHETTQEFKVGVPQQEVSHSSVRYRRDALTHGLDGFFPVGTIHSHADFNAFHSGTDEHDEESFDGLHLTFGHNHNENISISASVVMNGQRVQVDPAAVLDGVEAVEGRYKFRTATPEEDGSRPGPDDWMLQVTQQGSPLGCLFNQPAVAQLADFGEGDEVTWRDDLPDGDNWRRTYGQGPFKVIGRGVRFDAVMGPVVDVRTDIQGQFVFPVSFFKKAEGSNV